MQSGEYKGWEILPELNHDQLCAIREIYIFTPAPAVEDLDRLLELEKVSA